MSYDVLLFLPRPGVDPLTVAEALLERLEEGPSPGRREPARERWKAALADALVAHDPALTVPPLDHAGIARERGITEDEARERFRQLELSGPDDGSGVRITIDDDHALVTVPDRHRGDAAREAFGEVSGYLRVLAREGGLLAYDPQLERVVDPDEDFEAMLAAYGEGAGPHDRVTADLAPERKPRPWWKLW